jgi:hypothetical protein
MIRLTIRRLLHGRLLRPWWTRWCFPQHALNRGPADGNARPHQVPGNGSRAEFRLRAEPRGFPGPPQFPKPNRPYPSHKYVLFCSLPPLQTHRHHRHDARLERRRERRPRLHKCRQVRGQLGQFGTECAGFCAALRRTLRILGIGCSGSTPLRPILPPPFLSARVRSPFLFLPSAVSSDSPGGCMPMHLRAGVDPLASGAGLTLRAAP